MPFFRLCKEDFDAYEISGSRRYHLPGVHCPSCNEYRAEIGVGYPSVDLSKVPRAKSQLRADNVKLSTYESKVSFVRPHVAEERTLLPGVSFGPFAGKHYGRFFDFMWYIGEVFVSAETSAVLNAKGVSWRSCATELVGRDPGVRTLREIEAWPLARLHASCAPADTQPPCPRCGRWVVRTEKPVLSGDTIPPGVDVFRALGMTSWIFVTERFAEAVRSTFLTGYSLTQVDVA